MALQIRWIWNRKFSGLQNRKLTGSRTVNQQDSGDRDNDNDDSGDEDNDNGNNGNSG